MVFLDDRLAIVSEPLANLSTDNQVSNQLCFYRLGGGCVSLMPWLRRAAQRAFISPESLLRPPVVSAPFFRAEALVAPVFLLAAQRAFINWESRLRPAGVSCPFRFEGAAPPVPRILAQRALAAAESFALVAAEK
jgi:hypothetical protein